MAGIPPPPRSYWLEFILPPETQSEIDRIRAEVFPDLEWTKQTHITILYVGRYPLTEPHFQELENVISDHVPRLKENLSLFRFEEVVHGTWGDPVTFLTLYPLHEDILNEFYRMVYRYFKDNGFVPQMSGATEESRGSWHITLQYTHAKLEELKEQFKTWKSAPFRVIGIQLVEHDKDGTRPIRQFLF